MKNSFPSKRWLIFAPKTDEVARLVEATGLSEIVAQVLVNRGINTVEQAKVYIDPESEILPPPITEFPDLSISIDLLKEAITTGQKIVICGDYDADGMTSTALLLRALKHIGGIVEYEIPSRMKDGYGINQRLVEEFHKNKFSLILTVDNGISAYEPIARAKELGIKVIITDHHDLPEQLPPADAILNPKLLPETSPYRGLAGVGVAYILAVCTVQSLGFKGLTDQLLELYTLGTIADLAPLVDVNRRWLKRGLRKLPQSQLAGIQALIKMSGVNDQEKNLKPEDIGFKLGPRINAVGRISNPQIVIDLLTTDDEGIALENAMRCEVINRERQQLCEKIQEEAIALIEETPIPWREQRVLVLVQANWHHGVIGLVASRLVERYGVPVFVATYEEDDTEKLRGSARGIEEFNVFAALQFCADLLTKFGGHPAAGGFGLPAKNLSAFQERLSIFAHQCLEPEHLQPLVKIDAQAHIFQLNQSLYQQIDDLQPWGIGNHPPVFWTPHVRVIEQKIMGKDHLKLTFLQDKAEIKAIAWRWAEFFPLPNTLDIAYKMRQNEWNGMTNIEIELVAVRVPINSSQKEAIFLHNGRSYSCSVTSDLYQLKIKNEQGNLLVVSKDEKIGLMNKQKDKPQPVDITQPHYSQLIKAAKAALKV